LKIKKKTLPPPHRYIIIENMGKGGGGIYKKFKFLKKINFYFIYGPGVA